MFCSMDFLELCRQLIYFSSSNTEIPLVLSKVEYRDRQTCFSTVLFFFFLAEEGNILATLKAMLFILFSAIMIPIGKYQTRKANIYRMCQYAKSFSLSAMEIFL